MCDPDTCKKKTKNQVDKNAQFFLFHNKIKKNIICLKSNFISIHI